MKVQKQLQNDLAAIEEAALKAYQKDMNIQPSAQNSEASHEAKDTSVNEACSKGATTEACSVTYEGSQAVLKCSHSWNIAQAPQGYYYYYNTVTQASQWESPPCLSSPADKTSRNSAGNESASQESLQCVQSRGDESKTTETKKETVKNSPYGQWTTVQTFEIATALPKTEKENSATESEKEIKKSVKTEEKFKERSTPKITFRSALGAGNEIAFKKRKLNPDKKRNIRQTNPNKTE